MLSTFVAFGHVRFPSKPLRALSLVKHSGPEVIIAEACRRTGVQFEAYGHGVGKPIDNVEQRCAEADIVFTTARTALEAMASGAAVVLMDGRGFGGLVTTHNYDLGRSFNFGVGMLVQQPTLTALTDAVGAYCAEDAESVSRRVRQDADLDRQSCNSKISTPRLFSPARAAFSIRMFFAASRFSSAEPMSTNWNRWGNGPRNGANTSPDTNNSNAPDRSGLRRRYAASSADKQTTL